MCPKTFLKTGHLEGLIPFLHVPRHITQLININVSEHISMADRASYPSSIPKSLLIQIKQTSLQIFPTIPLNSTAENFRGGGASLVPSLLTSSAKRMMRSSLSHDAKTTF